MPRSMSLLFACAMAGLFVLTYGCGSRGGPGSGDGEGAVRIHGRLSVAGPTPFTTLQLTTEDGAVYAIEQSSIADELRELSGMDVDVAAQVLERPKGQPPAIIVFSYELLPLPSGERPIAGTIGGSPPDDVWLEDDTGKRWLIAGSLRPVLMEFFGAKVWIVGDRSTGDDGATIDVKGYGIIRAAPQ